MRSDASAKILTGHRANIKESICCNCQVKSVGFASSVIVSVIATRWHQSFNDPNAAALTLAFGKMKCQAKLAHVHRKCSQKMSML
jgi:hypothetical protein